MPDKILVTGAAGFIGFHLSKKLIAAGFTVVGLDNLNNYYDPNYKYSRLALLGIDRSAIKQGLPIKSNKFDFHFIQLSLEDKEAIGQVFTQHTFDYVCHLAAQAGVRYSLENPDIYIQSNIVGFLNILEACRHHRVKHLTYASSSSVYGLNENMPFSTSDSVDHPISLYAASKKSNELMAHTYSYLYQLPTTGLRFFTVYGPWGRPDMALFLFTKAILNDQPIDIYNNGEMLRDFTYIDDIVEGIYRVLNAPPKTGNELWNPKSPKPNISPAPYRVYNIGNNNTVKLMDYINILEKQLGKKAIKNYLPLQPGDVPATFADVTDLMADHNYKPSTSVETGITQFVKWYLDYHKTSL